MSVLPSNCSTDVAGKRALVRADLNVPMDQGAITDSTRIERFAPTVIQLLEQGASVVIMTHLGRPGGSPDPQYSTKALVGELSRALGIDVQFVDDCIGDVAVQATRSLKPGQVALLENLRFHQGETENSGTFADHLSANGDIYINDAFSCAHRAHASTSAITTLLPSFAGPSLIAEVSALELALENPRKPVAALVGGAKVSTKISVLKNLIPKVDYLIIGGGMANTFLAAQGHPMGSSLYEPDCRDQALEIVDTAAASGCEIVLPTDLVVASEFSANAPHQTVSADKIPNDMMALDVGAESRTILMSLLGKCKTLLWNGPLGAFEIDPFGQSTFEVAKIAADLTDSGSLTTVAGGGDTVAALNAAGVTDRFSYVSTAGGAFLEWIEGKELPGIEALKNANSIMEKS